VPLYLSYIESLNHYIQEAKIDIENDAVYVEFWGMSEGVKEEDFEKVDSIAASYGVRLGFVSCIINLRPYEKAEERYEKMTNEYLEKRNGKDWYKKMEKEIEPYVISWF